MPILSIWVRIRRTERSMSASLTWPLAVAAFSASPRNLPRGISMSRPAFSDGPALWVAPQSDVTKPAERQKETLGHSREPDVRGLSLCMPRAIAVTHERGAYSASTRPLPEQS